MADLQHSRRVCRGYCSAAAVFRCNAYSGQKRNGSLFRFPKDKERSKRWVIECGRKDLFGKSPEYLNYNCRLCAAHFTEDQFMNCKRDSLVWNAIPTIFTSYSSTSKAEEEPPSNPRTLPEKSDSSSTSSSVRKSPKPRTLSGNSDCSSTSSTSKSLRKSPKTRTLLSNPDTDCSSTSSTCESARKSPKPRTLPPNSDFSSTSSSVRKSPKSRTWPENSDCSSTDDIDVLIAREPQVTVPLIPPHDHLYATPSLSLPGTCTSSNNPISCKDDLPDVRVTYNAVKSIVSVPLVDVPRPDHQYAASPCVSRNNKDRSQFTSHGVESLVSKIVQLQEKLRICKAKSPVTEEKPSIEAVIKMAKDLGMKDSTARFFETQLRNSNCLHKAGQRWRAEDKSLALGVYSNSREAYAILSSLFILPSEYSLKKYLRGAPDPPAVEKQSKRQSNEDEVIEAPSAKKQQLFVFLPDGTCSYSAHINQIPADIPV